MSLVPQRIVLKSTTKISLNDRFGAIKAPAPVPVAVPAVRAHLMATQQASAKNRRLALQMAQRPTVQAALKLKKNAAVQQRLSVKERVGAPAHPGTSASQPGGIAARLGTVKPVLKPKVPGTSSQGFIRGSVNRGGISRGGFGRGGFNRGFSRGAVRGSYRGAPARGGGGRGGLDRQRGGGRGRFQRGGSSRGGRGRGRETASRGDLDNELDSYMSGH